MDGQKVTTEHCLEAGNMECSYCFLVKGQLLFL